jgi:hypothetical protein
VKLSRLPMVLRIAEERNALRAQLDSLDKRKICVSIDANRQDDTIIELIRPVLDCELRARIAVIDRDLAALGVVID